MSPATADDDHQEPDEGAVLERPFGEVEGLHGRTQGLEQLDGLAVGQGMHARDDDAVAGRQPVARSRPRVVARRRASTGTGSRPCRPACTSQTTRLAVAVEDRGRGHLDARRLRVAGERDAHGGAEAEGFGRRLQRQPDAPACASRHPTAARSRAPCPGRDALVGEQRHRRSAAPGGKRPMRSSGTSKTRVAHVRPRNRHDRLARRHDLPDLGAPGGDDAVIVAGERGVAELLLRLLQAGLGLVDPGLRGVARRDRRIDLGLRRALRSSAVPAGAR